MEQRISFVTLGVSNLSRAIKFYSSLGWKPHPKSQDNIAFFQTGGIVFALYPRDLLAEDVGVNPEGTGFRGFALAHNVREKSQVAETLKFAERHGGTIVKPAQDVFWGGHSGYFADPDGFYWEVAFNPFSTLRDDGSFLLS